MHVRPLWLATGLAAFLTVIRVEPVEAQFLDHLALDVMAGGGFVGTTTRDVETSPHFNCEGNPIATCLPVEAFVALRESVSKSWQPAIATGLVIRYVFRPRADPNDATRIDGIGLGVGGNFVFVPSGDSTKAAPALTLHFGTSGQQLFFGWLFTWTRSVILSGGRQTSFQRSSILRRCSVPEGRARPPSLPAS